MVTAKTVGFLSLWLGFVVYAIFLAPNHIPTSDTIDLIVRLSTAQWQEENPIIVCLFNIMGILPLVYLAFLWLDYSGQKINPTPFLVASFFVGVFALLPYLAFRQPPSLPADKNKNLATTILSSRLFAVTVAFACIFLLLVAIIKGDWQDFWYQWQNSKFIHVMSLDFCLLSLLLPVVVYDDLTARGIDSKIIFWAITVIPLIGPLVYLFLRPPYKGEKIH